MQREKHTQHKYKTDNIHAHLGGSGLWIGMTGSAGNSW